MLNQNRFLLLLVLVLLVTGIVFQVLDVTIESLTANQMIYLNVNTMLATATVKPTTVMPTTAMPPKSLISITEWLVPLTSRFEDEFLSQLVASMSIFFPPGPHSMTIVMDDEKPEDHRNAVHLHEKLNKSGIKSTFFFTNPEPSIYNFDGHIRQTYSVLWGDNYTSAEYIGFIDSDAVFTTRVTEYDLFNNDKPVVIGLVGSPHHTFWTKVMSTTEYGLKMNSVMRGMAFFPVIVKRKHLAALRNHVEKVHGKPFDEVFYQLSRKPFCQYTLICNFLWWFYRDEYSFSLLDRRPGWSGNVTGQISMKELRLILSDPVLTHPKVRVAVHWGYLGEGDMNKWFKGSDKLLKEVLSEGRCRSFGVSDRNCTTEEIERTKIHKNLFLFEGNSWEWDPRCKEAQRLHYEAVDRELGMQRVAMANAGS